LADNTVTTIDHDEIRTWATTRGGKPAVLDGVTDVTSSPVLQVSFDADDGTREISWEEFFRLLDEGRLALVHAGDNDPDHTFRLVSRAEAEAEAGS
jgi:hypothetical protein